MAKFAVILPAAGRSSRFHDQSYKKPFAPLANKAVWLHSAERFLGRSDVVQTILVIAPEDRDDFNFKFSANVAILGIEVIDGGPERADSVEAALARVKPEADFVCVHDAARPCSADAWIDEIFAAAEKSGAAIFAMPVAGTLKRVGADRQDRGDRFPRGTLGGADAAGLPPPAALGRLRQAGRLRSHRRRPTGRADRPSGHGRARLADQHEDHHQGRPAAGRAGHQGAAQAEAWPGR